MKKRKSGFLQRMMAVLLSVVLVVSMVSNAAPMTVLAQESVSGNTPEPVEGDRKPAEGVDPEKPDDKTEEKTPGTGAEGGGGQESVSGNEPGTGENTPNPDDGGSGEGEASSEDAEEETQDTVSGNDVDSVSGNDINLKAQKTNGKERIQPWSVEGEITADMTWANGSSVSEVTIKGGTTENSAVVITVEGSVTVTDTITVSSGYVRFTGGGSLNWQSSYINNAIVVQDGANSVFENVTLDGSKGNRFRQSALLFQGTGTFGNGTKVQNFSSDTGSGAYAGFKGVIAVHGKGSLTVTEGVTITGNRSTSGIIAIYQNDSGGGESTASVTMSGGTIAGNTVGNSSLGVIWNWCGKLNISGGTVTAEGNEYAVHTQGNHSAYDATTVISGGTFTGNILGAVCAGKDSTNNSRITIKGGTFAGKTAVTANYGEINIEGGSFKGNEYALQTLNTGAALNVAGGEFYGNTAAYGGNVTTTTGKVIVGTSKESAANWDKSTDLSAYKYVAIGELTEQPGADEKHEHNGIIFTPWTKTDSLPPAAGYYYLTENVTLSRRWDVPGGTMILCLNGKTIRGSSQYSVITIAASAALNLYDCRNAGNITGGKGGVINNGTFRMYGGKISGNSGNSGTYGGGVGTSGTFEMYGGEISGNNVMSGFSGVYVADGIFRMYGGKIINNNGVRGVYIENGTFIVGGDAVISDNTFDGKTYYNVYLRDGQTIQVDSSKPLSGLASIGVTTQTKPIAGKPIAVTSPNKDDCSKYFHSDNAKYEITNTNNVVQLILSHTHNLTLTPAKPATCTEDGNKAYYTCDGCDKWFLDAAGTQEITDKTSVVIAKTGHDYDGTAWSYREADGHAHKCKNCDAYDSVQEHIPGDAATETTPQTCTVCGYIMVPAIGHTCNPQLVEKKEPDCTTAGKEAYYHCGGCGKNYEDAEGNSVIADISAWGNIAALGHDWGEWKVIKPATATKPGQKERTCKRCNEKQSETIPKTGGGSKPGGGDQNDDGQDGNNSNDGGNGSGSSGGDQGSGTGTGGGNNAGNASGTGAGTPKTPGASGTGKPKVKQEKEGNIRKEVRVEGENMLDAAVETPLSELADMVLTKEEKQKAANGTDIRIVLDVKDASAIVNAADKALVEAALNGSLAKGYTLGQYLAISLYKVIGSSRTDITETDGKITVRIDVPDSLKNTDTTKTRTFAVIRVHGGKAELLSDLDNNADTITIATDRFSTYAIVYKDTTGENGSVVRISVEDGSEKSGGAKDDEPKTGDNTPLELCATLSMIAGFAYLLLYFADRERGMTEETKKELVSRLVAWAKQGGRIRRWLALAAIFVLLVYYHSIGKKTCAEWKAIYGE